MTKPPVSWNIWLSSFKSAPRQTVSSISQNFRFYQTQEGGGIPGFISDGPLARELIRIGDEAIAREDEVALRAYFSEDYVFHGPRGDLSFDQLREYFASLRAAFSDLRLVREQIIVDGNFLAARTTFSGDFTAVFTYSPIGPVEATGQHLEWEVIGTFRYDDEGRLTEEWVQTDYRSFLSKLGVTTTESV
jgi:predicted ester cyclase